VTRGKGVRPFGDHVGDPVPVYFTEITSVSARQIASLSLITPADYLPTPGAWVVWLPRCRSSGLWLWPRPRGVDLSGADARSSSAGHPSRATAMTCLRRSRSGVWREVLAGSARAREFVEHAVQGAESDRQVTFAFFQVRRGTGKLGGKPLAVGERHA